MSYDNVTELPDSVRENIPKRAQEIYKAAFNSAWDKFADSGDRHSEATREAAAHRIAWSAVTQWYEKTGGVN